MVHRSSRALLSRRTGSEGTPLPLSLWADRSGEEAGSQKSFVQKLFNKITAVTHVTHPLIIDVTRVRNRRRYRKDVAQFGTHIEII
jgi:hypothetical protein